ncbi:Signal transduction histidine kinase [Ralstonia sp. 25mfcol4.1]|uniref:sensor histidine kinase n=1 Tax=Burkholderiaceae TaxID=119060 RepID=UPI000881B252|nr:HAMP domain-containing sensor histidine kinase [Ralstonia sp. 25mfcol4.1]SDO96801.1 Signal transduction histidine kinase [Ralstonia sp. 25mfcol4.1]
MNLSLTQRLSAVFAALLLACCGASAWLQVRANAMHEKEVIQSLSRGLAAYIARNALLEDQSAIAPQALRQLFGQLMVVNPSVEVYLLDDQGHIRGHDAPSGHLIRDRVDLAPVKKLIDGGALPILGDDPRSASGRKVFSAAPLRQGGYIYVVLMGETHDRLAARASQDSVMRTTLWSMALVASLGLIAGLVAFALITRPLRRLTNEIRQFDSGDAYTAGDPQATPAEPVPRDEMAALESAFRQMSDRIDSQWRALKQQDQERREMVANISHDLRTPLTSLHGYLETLSVKADSLSADERQRYLAIALAQSAKVGGLAQALFELARLEHGMVQAVPEDFSMVDLTQDVLEKFALPAEAKHLQLRAGVPPALPAVSADLGMIERVLTNLLDNAIRHTPAGGTVEIDLASQDGRVAVTVSDTGPGIPPALRESIFQRPFPSGGAHRGGGLGLLIVQRMLQLNGSQVKLVDRQGGTTLTFALRAAAR